MLLQREQDKPWRLGKLYLTSLRTLLEGKREESLAVSEELMQATFRDPEGMYYLGRQLAYLRQEAKPCRSCLAPSITDFSAIRQCCATLGWIRFAGGRNLRERYVKCRGYGLGGTGIPRAAHRAI